MAHLSDYMPNALRIREETNDDTTVCDHVVKEEVTPGVTVVQYTIQKKVSTHASPYNDPDYDPAYDPMFDAVYDPDMEEKLSRSMTELPVPGKNEIISTTFTKYFDSDTGKFLRDGPPIEVENREEGEKEKKNFLRKKIKKAPRPPKENGEPPKKFDESKKPVSRRKNVENSVESAGTFNPMFQNFGAAPTPVVVLPEPMVQEERVNMGMDKGQVMGWVVQSAAVKDKINHELPIRNVEKVAVTFNDDFSDEDEGGAQMSPKNRLARGPKFDDLFQSIEYSGDGDQGDENVESSTNVDMFKSIQLPPNDVDMFKSIQVSKNDDHVQKEEMSKNVETSQNVELNTTPIPEPPEEEEEEEEEESPETDSTFLLVGDIVATFTAVSLFVGIGAQFSSKIFAGFPLNDRLPPMAASGFLFASLLPILVYIEPNEMIDRVTSAAIFSLKKVTHQTHASAQRLATVLLRRRLDNNNMLVSNSKNNDHPNGGKRSKKSKFLIPKSLNDIVTLALTILLMVVMATEIVLVVMMPMYLLFKLSAQAPLAFIFGTIYAGPLTFLLQTEGGNLNNFDFGPPFACFLVGGLLLSISGSPVIFGAACAVSGAFSGVINFPDIPEVEDLLKYYETLKRKARPVAAALVAIYFFAALAALRPFIFITGGMSGAILSKVVSKRSPMIFLAFCVCNVFVILNFGSPLVFTLGGCVGFILTVMVGKVEGGGSFSFSWGQLISTSWREKSKWIDLSVRWTRVVEHVNDILENEPDSS